jgi:hypothetical protein
VSHDDFAVEPVPGLPAALPAGESLLWQGQPRWQTLALRGLHARKVAIYFAVLAAWSGVAALYDDRGLAAAAWIVATQLLLGALAAGMLTGIAWLAARATLYTITTQRVVIRFGVALTMSINLPFTMIQSAGLRRHRAGTGDIPLGLAPGERVSYLILWPHVRPWRFRHVEPMLRCIPDVDAVARLLADALARRHGIEPAAIAAEDVPQVQPSRPVPASAAAAGGARTAGAVVSA